MRHNSEIWHEYMHAAITTFPDSSAAACANAADDCLAEYIKRWGKGEESATEARRVIAETTTDQSSPPATCPPEMREAVALCWALAGGGMTPPTLHSGGKVTLRSWYVWAYTGRVMYARDRMPIARSALTADAAARENGVHHLYCAALALLTQTEAP